MQFLPTFTLGAELGSGSKAAFGGVQSHATTPFAHILEHAAATSQELGQPRTLMDAKAAAFAVEDGSGAAVSNRQSAARSASRSAAGAASSRVAGWGSGTSAAASGTASAAASAGSNSIEAKLRTLLSLGEGSNRGVGRSLQSLTVTREDFAALRDGLAQYGFTASELEEMQSLVNSSGGLTWGRLVSAASRKMAGLDAFPQDLSQDETQAIQSFFQKAGFTPQEADDLLGKLRRGETPAVWQALAAKIATQSEDGSLDLDKDELAALSKALRLDSSQTDRLHAVLGEGGSAQLPIKDLKAVLAELKTDEGQATEERTAQATALRDLVAEAYAAARKKAGVSDKADRRPDDATRRTQVLAEAHADDRKAEKEAPRPLSGKDADQDAGQVRTSRLPGTGRSVLAEDAASRNASDGRGTEDGRRQNREASSSSSSEGAAAGTAKSAQGEDQKAWAEFMGKVTKETAGQKDVRTEARSAAADAAAGLNAEAAALKAEAAAATASSGLEKFTAREVLGQVESGIYRNLGEGTKQLSLRLDPPELGKLNLQLTVRGQEVNVVLKAENADAGRLLQENLGQLRQVLENQGLKVGKLEVQTQLAGGGQEQAWSGTDRHNEAREQGEASRALDRMRLLRGGGDVVSQVQTADASARSSHPGLSVIA